MGLSQHFQNRWDSPKKRWDRVKIPIPAFFFPGASNCRAMNVGIGSPNLYRRFSKALGKAYALYQCFWKRWNRYGKKNDQNIPLKRKKSPTKFQNFLKHDIYIYIHTYKFTISFIKPHQSLISLIGLDLNPHLIHQW